MGIEMYMTWEGVAALREFADAMPLAIENIVESTEELVRVYQSVAESVGPHNQDFYNMLLLIKAAQEKSSEAIQALPPMLISTAEKMEVYLNTHPTVSGK